jgi:signal transduction histidine kinase
MDYRLLFESAPNLYLVLTPSFDIVAVSDAYLKATLTQRDQIIGRGLFDVFPDDPNDPGATGVHNLNASLQRVLATARPDSMAVQKYAIRLPEEHGGGFEERYWSPVNTPVIDHQGHIVNIIHRVEDVTDFIRLQHDLQRQSEDTGHLKLRSEQLAQEILARSAELGEANRQLKTTNQALLHIYDEVATLVARADDELHIPDSSRLPRAQDPANLVPEELINQISRLIQGHKRLEEELRQAQKMEAVGRLAGGIAHDFNNTLTVILGYCDLLLARMSPTDPLREKVADVQTAGQRAAELTDQMLTFSRRQVVAPKVINLAGTLSEVERLLRRAIGEHIEFAVSVAPDVGRIRADSGQIQQVLMNLVVNARDAMPRGGKLTIGLVNAVVDDESTAHFDVPPGHYVALSVTDTGTGMTPDVKARIFEPFFTTKEAGKGTGLGLATVYGIVKQCGGFIWLYTEVGVGTSFRLFFPRVHQPATEVAVPAATPSLASGNKSILVVEDDPLIRALIQEILTGMGHTVQCAKHPEEALQLCHTLGPLHLLLTDVVMPKMNGRELADRIARQRPGIRILLMSGYTGEAMSHQEILIEPGRQFLQKPFTMRTLSDKVRQALE